MIEIIWEFVVTEQARGHFELAFGPGGAWSDLFSRCAGFRGTTVLRDTKTPRRYLVVDLWDTEAQRGQALADHETQYAHLEASLEKWVESKAAMGVFTVLADATVRPRGGARRK